jgi:hypothetical protein
MAATREWRARMVSLQCNLGYRFAGYATEDT